LAAATVQIPFVSEAPPVCPTSPTSVDHHPGTSCEPSERCSTTAVVNWVVSWLVTAIPASNDAGRVTAALLRKDQFVPSRDVHARTEPSFQVSVSHRGNDKVPPPIKVTASPASVRAELDFAVRTDVENGRRGIRVLANGPEQYF
jgi:hypothetical protein